MPMCCVMKQRVMWAWKVLSCSAPEGCSPQLGHTNCPLALSCEAPRLSFDAAVTSAERGRTCAGTSMYPSPALMSSLLSLPAPDADAPLCSWSGRGSAVSPLLRSSGSSSASSSRNPSPRMRLRESWGADSG